MRVTDVDATEGVRSLSEVQFKAGTQPKPAMRRRADAKFVKANNLIDANAKVVSYGSSFKTILVKEDYSVHGRNTGEILVTLKSKPSEDVHVAFEVSDKACVCVCVRACVHVMRAPPLFSPSHGGCVGVGVCACVMCGCAL